MSTRDGGVDFAGGVDLTPDAWAVPPRPAVMVTTRPAPGKSLPEGPSSAGDAHCVAGQKSYSGPSRWAYPGTPRRSTAKRDNPPSLRQLTPKPSQRLSTGAYDRQIPVSRPTPMLIPLPPKWTGR